MEPLPMTKGSPCMLGETVGRIVEQDQTSAFILNENNEKIHAVLLFSTPHGSVIKTGRLHLSEITEEGMAKLIEYEKDAKLKPESFYNRMLTPEEVELLNK